MLMPEMDGLQVLEKLKADPDLSRIPVIIVSALDDMESIAQCIEIGAVDYLIKPFNPRLLHARIKACLIDKWMQDMQRTYLREIQAERQKAEDLLLNILPESIARQLQKCPGIIADNFDDVTILFADIAGFTQLASGVAPEKIVALLNDVFSMFDDLADQRSLEKIKTIGDAYLLVGGLPLPRPGHTEAVADMALAMLKELDRFNIRHRSHSPPLQLRIGIHCGPVTAGVIGRKKFIYDLWGDSVNIASRLQSQGEPDRIQVSGEMYDRLHRDYLFAEQGEIELRGRGKIRSYWLQGHRER